MQSYRPSILRNPAAIIAAQCLSAALLYSAATVRAQHLPFRHYGTTAGLAGSRVAAVHQDAKGYLWFGTTEGLSRFDGYRFVNYGMSDGLGHTSVNTITEDQHGRLWVGTNGGGVARLEEDRRRVNASGHDSAAAHRRFISYRVGESQYSNRVNAILFDERNTLWCATDQGLYRSAQQPSGELGFQAIVPHEASAQIMAAYDDRQGRLWFGIRSDLVEIGGGRVIRHGVPTGRGHDEITAIAEDRQGRLLVAFGFSVFEFAPAADGHERGQWKDFPLPLGPDCGEL